MGDFRAELFHDVPLALPDIGEEAGFSSDLILRDVGL